MKIVFAFLILVFSGCKTVKSKSQIVYNYDSVDEMIMEDTARYIRVHAGDSLIKIPRNATVNINVLRNLITSENTFKTKIDSAKTIIYH